MSESPNISEESPEDNVVSLDAYRWSERIAGIQMALHRLGYDELVQLEASCKERADEARFEAAIVEDYRNAWYPDGPPSGPGAA